MNGYTLTIVLNYFIVIIGVEAENRDEAQEAALSILGDEGLNIDFIQEISIVDQD